MKKFVARIDLSYGCRAEITEVEVEKETEASVWRKGRRCAKISTYENYFDTWSEAKRLIVATGLHMIAGTIMGWRLMPGIDRGEGQAGLIMLGGSSLQLKKLECIDAITQAFLIGDDPSTQGLNSPPVRWCAEVCNERA